MPRFEQLLERLKSYGKSECLVSRSVSYLYSDLENKRRSWLHTLRSYDIERGSIIGLKAEYSIESISLFLALLSHRCIVTLVPFSSSDDDTYIEDGFVQGIIRFPTPETWTWERFDRSVDHSLISELRKSGAPGFTIFTSGSSGRPKAALQSVERFLSKFDTSGKKHRTLTFLLFDHIAGLDTLFYTISNGGTVILPDSRDPKSICRLIQDTRVEVLPVSPSFLTLLCLSHGYEMFDLSSLQIITYGSEPMSSSTLDKLNAAFPNVRIVQKYGTTEFGSPRSISRGNDSLWFKLKGDNLTAKVVDEILWIRTRTAMLGYLNAPSPFDKDGWYCTGDIVKRDGDWIQIVGRKSDVIIVGGEKVHPQEVERVISELDFVRDVLVKGESHPLMGQIVTAQVSLTTPLDSNAVAREIRKHCRYHLEPYKAPVKVDVTSASLTTNRQKKVRK